MNEFDLRNDVFFKLTFQ